MGSKREHHIKCWPQYFAAVRSGEKTFEVRRDDRGYQRGDVLVLREYDPRRGVTENSHYTREEERREITWILTGGQFGIEPGFVVLALGLIAARKGGDE